MSGPPRWSVSRLLPRAFRQRFGRDLTDAIADLRRDAREAGGRRAEFRYLAREVRDMVALAARLRRHRDSRTDGGWRGIGADARWAFRYARHRRAWTLSVALTLAATIAVLTSAFGLARAVLWRPLPFRDEARLVLVWERAAGTAANPEPFRVTGARFADWRDHSRAFESMAMFGATALPLETDDGVRLVGGVRVSDGFFRALGISPLLGRAFVRDDARPGAARVVILSYEFWKSTFAGSATAIGADVRLGGEPYRVIGVMPRALYPGWPVNPASVTIDPDAHQFWIPFESPGPSDENARSHLYGVLARLRPGTSIQQAVAELNGLASTSSDRHGATAVLFRSQLVRAARTPLLILVCTALAVLLIACANLAALQVAAFDARRDELTTRVAVGAGAVRLSRQLAVEAALVCGAGGAVGLLVGRAVLARLPGWLPTTMPFMTPPGLDGTLVAIAVAGSGTAATLMIAWPVAQVWRSRAALRPVRARARAAWYRTAIAAQVAVTTALVASAAVLVRSLENIRSQDAGFTIDGVLTADLGLPDDASRDAAATAVAEGRLLDRLAQVPDVTGAALAYDLPLAANWIDAYTLVGAAADSRDLEGQAQLRIVSPGYFRALDVRVLEGRTFSSADDLDARGVAVVNRAFARVHGSAVGRHLRSSAARGTWGASVADDFEIIGVVADERFQGLDEPSEPAVYLSTRQFPLTQATLLVTRTPDGRVGIPEIRAAVREVEPRASFEHARPLAAIAAEQLAPRRLTADVVSLFSLGALLLAALGLYGLLGMLVAGQRRDIGVRLALGASPARVAQGVVIESVAITGIGVIAGAVLAVASGRALDAWLFQVRAATTPLLAAIAAVLLTVAIVVALIPARRAAATDPTASLRAS